MPKLMKIPNCCSGMTLAPRNERKPRAVVTDVTRIGRPTSLNAFSVATRGESTRTYTCTRSSRCNSSVIEIAIKTTGRIVVTRVTGAPVQPIAPKTQISTMTASARGMTTPPKLFKLK